MEKKRSITKVFAWVAMLMLFSACSSHRGLVFADREWHISSYYGQIIDKDTTYRMTFGNVIIPDPLPIISSADSVAKYPGMDRFLSDILHTCRLDSAEILFYAPHMQKMFVRLRKPFPPMKPASITTPMSDENPYTMWVHKEDIEDWTREPSEMYTYTYYNKGKKQLLIADHFDYGDVPVVQITIFQSKNRLTSKMAVHDNIRRAYSELHDIGKFMDDVQYWSHGMELRRDKAISNYKIGQEQKTRKKWNVH